MDIKSSIKMMGVSSQFGIDSKNFYKIINYLIQEKPIFWDFIFTQHLM